MIRVLDVVQRAEAKPARRRPRSAVARGYESVDSIVITEPRIEAIRRELQALLEVVELESGGQPVAIDGFRLRSPSDWADSPASLSDIFWHLSAVCNFDCDFCYEKGNPPDFPIRDTPRMATEDEIETRLKYYDPGAKRGIFTIRSSINEPFANRRALEFLRKMRARSPDELISFVTNGSYLTEELIAGLAELHPLFFNLSLYSTDEEVRRHVLRDRRGRVAVDAVPLLARYGVPYMANLVMWPSIPFSDMERTIAYVAEHRATLMRICLGGYSRYLSMDIEPFAAADYWPEVVAAVERLRDRYAMPILIEPSSYVRRETETWIDGVIAGSPAERAGLRRGDRVLEVDGRPVKSRMQLLGSLRRAGSASYRPPGVTATLAAGEAGIADRIRLTIEREGATFPVTLDRFEAASMDSYPYGKIARFEDFVCGLIVTDCLRYSSLLDARRIMEKAGARKVLLLSSEMIEPMLRHMLDRTGAFDGFDVAVRVAPNRYFGGTINIGDLLVVSDFIQAARDFAMAEGHAPDLILIPASPFGSSPWGRDLTGRPWTDIERALGIPVALIPCANLTF